MPAVIDSAALQMVFSQPKVNGSFEEHDLRYLRSVGARRAILLLAFAPKAAGTYFREAAMHAIDGQLFRLAHSQGGRDGTPYLPMILACCLDEDPHQIVSHMHMQALESNRHLLNAFGIKPVIMLRNLPDMLASFLDMLNADAAARAEGLNCLIPDAFMEFGQEQKRDFLVDIVAPWYASYFATWKLFADEEPETVCVLRYTDFRTNPAEALHKALTHAGFKVSPAKCEDALARVWKERKKHRFNKGVAGRGAIYFSQKHFEKLSNLLSYYRNLSPWLPELMGETEA